MKYFLFYKNHTGKVSGSYVESSSYLLSNMGARFSGGFQGASMGTVFTTPISNWVILFVVPGSGVADPKGEILKKWDSLIGPGRVSIYIIAPS